MKVLVATITHRADDARIFARQIPALIDAGDSVTAIAPWKSSGVSPQPEISSVNTPRTNGRRRLWALIRGVFAVIRRGSQHDVILVHDPELALALALTPLRRKTIWDVHEDLPAALRSKSYLPAPLSSLLSKLATFVELFIEKRMRLLLAEERYAERFARPHPIIFNLPRVPAHLPSATTKQQVIYVGSITKARGLEMMLQIARELQRDQIQLRLVGEIPSQSDRDIVQSAPNVQWSGPMANSAALDEVESSIAGLSLLADLPNYRHSMPTKILEYMSRGTPVISTPLALAQAAIGDNGFIVSFDHERGGRQAVEAIRELARNDAKREEIRNAAFKTVSERYNWSVHQREFVSSLRSEG